MVISQSLNINNNNNSNYNNNNDAKICETLGYALQTTEFRTETLAFGVL